MSRLFSQCSLWFSHLFVTGALVLVLCGCTTVERIPPGPVIFAADFDGGPNDERVLEPDIHGGGFLERVDQPVRAGTHAMGFFLPADGVRTEIRVRRPLDPIGSERWYGFSVYLPETWQPHPDHELVVQWRSTVDGHLGEIPRSPVVGLRIDEDRWHISCRWDSRRRTHRNECEGRAVLWKGPYEVGRWTDWVFHVKWSYRADGRLRAWRDGELVVDHSGPNCFNDRRGLFVKFGLYHSPLDRTLYQDEWRIGDATASYQDVEPGRTVETSTSKRQNVKTSKRRNVGGD